MNTSSPPLKLQNGTLESCWWFNRWRTYQRTPVYVWWEGENERSWGAKSEDGFAQEGLFAQERTLPN
jgi:hypothetical protein